MKVVLNPGFRKYVWKKLFVFSSRVLPIVVLFLVVQRYIQENKRPHPETPDTNGLQSPIDRLKTRLDGAKIKTLPTKRRAPRYISLLNRKARKVKTILTWNDFFGIKHYAAGVGRAPFKRLGCKVFDCELWHRLDDPEPTLPYEEYDAIVFHGIDTGNSTMEDLPLVRSSHQRYVFSLGESPAMRPEIYNMRDFFNWTATYRSDSDLHQPYVVFKNKLTGKVTRDWMVPTFEDLSHVPDSISSKTKLVAWLSSNSHSQSKRHIYAEELSQHISLDIYGEDKVLKCPRNESTACDKMVEKDYEFYLAFENSLCDEYLTEKILRPFRYNTVPVVYGGDNYKTLVPPHSYIDVRDFKSPRLLADYLHYLHQNPREYRKYFWWKAYYHAEGGMSFWCNLCEKLNKADMPNKVYPNIEAWWFYPRVCQSPEEHFNGTRN